MTSPIRPTDDEARNLAQSLLREAKTAALAVIDNDGAPLVTRIGFALGTDGWPTTLISQLSMHTSALQKRPMCSLLVGGAGTRGDPLNNPRLTLQGSARLISHGTPDYSQYAKHWVAQKPKSKLYINFADFMFASFAITIGHLNGGFGKAFRLSPVDMGMPG